MSEIPGELVETVAQAIAGVWVPQHGRRDEWPRERHRAEAHVILKLLSEAGWLRKEDASDATAERARSEALAAALRSASQVLAVESPSRWARTSALRASHVALRAFRESTKETP